MTITERLALLGSDPLTIASRLLNLGIRGKRDEPCNCPIANYLTQCGYVDVMVLATGVDFYECGLRTCARLPLVVADFVEEFDRGEFPELVA